MPCQTPRRPARVMLPSTENGLSASGLRFGAPHTIALLACLSCFQHLFAGLTSRSLRELIAELIRLRPAANDLRPTPPAAQVIHPANPARSGGRADQPGKDDLAVFFIKTCTRIVNPLLAELDSTLPADIANRTSLGNPGARSSMHSKWSSSQVR